MRTEHLRFLLGNAEGRRRLLEHSFRALRVGLLTALQKPNGGVRGIVVGNVIWRLVAKTTLAQSRFQMLFLPELNAKTLHTWCNL